MFEPAPLGNDMTNHVLLDNVTHKDLRVITRHSADFGDDVSAVPTFPTEYSDIQREYPILLRKPPGEDGFLSVALLGLEDGENLFLENGHWTARYVPGIVARGPFLIGFQEREADGDVRREPVIHVDMDDPRVSETEGEPVFLEHGGNSPYLAHIANVLKGIHEGMAVGREMLAAFDACGLIEPVELELALHSDVQYVLKGYYTISQDRLRELDGDTLARLNGAGYLQGAFLVIASLDNLKTLIEMKQARATRQRAAC